MPSTPPTSHGYYLPTAVNFPRTCKIMVTVMIRATMCMALAAPWKMMVLASSILRAKQSGSIPTPLEIDVMGPIDEHNGNGAIRQIPVKSPNAMVGGGGESFGGLASTRAGQSRRRGTSMRGDGAGFSGSSRATRFRREIRPVGWWSKMLSGGVLVAVKGDGRAGG